MLSRIPASVLPTSRCIIMLHGIGSNENDLFSLASRFPEEDYIFSLQGPFSLGGARYAWYPVDFSTGKPLYNIQDVIRGYESIRENIRDIQEKYSIRPDQIYLMGFSQGAIMSYYTLSRSPDILRGIIGLSGRLIQEIDSDDVDSDQYIDKRIFIGHGVDDQVIGVTETGPIATFSRSLGIEPTLRFYDIGHTISPEGVSDIVTWLKN